MCGTVYSSTYNYLCLYDYECLLCMCDFGRAYGPIYVYEQNTENSKSSMADAKIFELNNGNMQVLVSNYGCTITSLRVPDKNGQLADVVLGFDTIEPYQKGAAPYFGCIVGRVANRIKDGKFALDGVEYSLPINKPPNSLHGGNKGFDKVIWEVAEYTQGDTPSITFKYHSHDGEEGYPGDVSFTAKYTLTSKTTMRLDMEGLPQNKPTPISLAQHTYWNLAGHNSGKILDHTIQILAHHITPVDNNTVPTGEIMPVKNTPFDFTAENKIGNRINEVGIGYDHNYVLDCGEEKSGLKHAARLRDPVSSRTLDLWTNAPGMQFYTANYVKGILGKGGAVYEKHAATCLETQGFPNAVNQPNFPSVVVRPGEKYVHTMLFEFSA
ncbi:aldose 1-epimerase [Striga asiatica]|uniref:Aldose 1-epimerase n=1 Tax=Striga asiatica TaxID=4170 RepID=A0A5A7P6Z6_STRAF|nr:aldose 1-epimerase [Striga asiatica]